MLTGNRAETESGIAEERDDKERKVESRIDPAGECDSGYLPWEKLSGRPRPVGESGVVCGPKGV